MTDDGLNPRAKDEPVATGDGTGDPVPSSGLPLGNPVAPRRQGNPEADSVSPALPPGADAEPGTLASPAEFQPLDPRVINLWRVTHLIVTAVLLLGGLVAVVIVGFANPAAWLWLWSGWGALAVLRAWLWFFYLPRAYAAWGYRLDGKVLETRHGVWFRTVQLLPLSRLQHVDLHSGPLERSFGLSSLLLHTAGTQHASITIPGLDAHEAVRLRDQLVVKGGDDGV